MSWIVRGTGVLRWLVWVMLWLLASGACAEQVYRVGVTSFRDKAVTLQEWGPTMSFLSGQVADARFEVVPLTLPEFEDALARRELDFVLTNPQHYIVVEARFGVSRVATLVKRENGKLVKQFGGVVFTRRDRQDIRRLEDVRGRRIAAVDRTSFAAYLLQYDLLKLAGVDIERDCQLAFFGFPQDLVVRAVLDGRADVGFVRTGVLEAMAQEGKIDLASLTVVSALHTQDFPFLVSTELYPEWPLAAAPHVSIDITNKVVAALLLMPPDGPAARSARYYRWSTPLEYQRVQALMRRHRIYPYDSREPIPLSDVLREYSVPILAGVLAFSLALVVLYVRTHRLNVALKRSRQRLSEMAHRDALTGLPNRNLLDDRLAFMLAKAQRSGARIAVCLLDLDGFKPINDQWGHQVGDRVLREVAVRLSAALRDGDTVARWGGDEFVLLLEGAAADWQLFEIMKRVLAAVGQDIDVCPGCRVTASIGVSLFPSDALEAEQLLQHADQAMYEAKKEGGDRFVVYSAAGQAESPALPS
ncbi:MAG: diguanylate cyclase [Zoogloea sp.]|nr:diguanylate cyclase [Zoogloea sp.]MCA0185351.1 diguanylate cyclase [Pseudomonadota bacterium]